MLLVKLLSAVLCCQFTVSVESVPSFTVAVERPQLVESEAKPSRRYLAMFTASWCQPCRQWKRDVLPKLRDAGYRVELIDMDQAANRRTFGKAISRYPSFLVCDYETGKWLSDVTVGGIDLAAAKRMLDGPNQEKPKQRVVSFSRVTPPVRYIQWPGWPDPIDLETYNRDCNCSMCVSIREMQKEYWKQLKAFQQQMTLSPDQEGCPYEVVESMLDGMQLRRSDILGDLGCGDARILISAARRGIRGIGIEIDPARADVARRAVRDAELEHLVTIETGDALEFDAGRITCATLFLYPPLLAKLAPKLKGLRVVASPYHEIPGLEMSRAGDVWIYRKG